MKEGNLLDLSFEAYLKIFQCFIVQHYETKIEDY